MHVKTRISRPDPNDIKKLAPFSSATVHEAQGRRGALSSTLKPVDRSMRFCGPAVTVRCAPGDNIMLQIAIHYAQAGDVIVVTSDGYTEAGTCGDVLATAMQAKGIAALVTDSGVRDTAGLIELGLPVFSANVCIKGTVKETLGTINHPIVVGGQTVRPGDVLLGDADGVVLVLPDEVAEVAEKSAARDAHEDHLKELYRAGGTTIELCNLTDVLAQKGLTVEE